MIRESRADRGCLEYSTEPPDPRSGYTAAPLIGAGICALTSVVSLWIGRPPGGRRGCPPRFRASWRSAERGSANVGPMDDTGAVLRIANFSGFYGDRLSASREMVEGGWSGPAPVC